MTEVTSKIVQIQGEEFTLPIRYTEGVVLSAIEAKVLSQTWCENVRNNTAKFIKAANDEDNEMTMAQAHDEVYAAANEYEFTAAAAAGSRSSYTPEQKEARKIAREGIRAELAAAGRKMSDIGKEVLEAAVHQASEMPHIVKIAKKRVKEAQSASEGILAGLDLSGTGEVSEIAAE